MISVQISPDVAALVRRLIDSKPGDKVTYLDLNAAAGRDIQRTARWMFPRAVDVAARDHGALFANIKGVGYQRLAVEDAHMLGSTARSSIRRKARRAKKRIVSAVSRANYVEPEACRKANAEISILGVIEHLSKEGAAKPQVEHEASPQPVAITMQRLLREMGAA